MIASNDTLTLSSLHRRMTGFYMCAVACSYGYGSESSPIQISVNKGKLIRGIFQNYAQLWEILNPWCLLHSAVMSPPPVRVELVTALEDVAEGKDYELRCVTLAKKDDGKLPKLERLFWGYNVSSIQFKWLSIMYNVDYKDLRCSPLN